MRCVLRPGGRCSWPTSRDGLELYSTSRAWHAVPARAGYWYRNPLWVGIPVVQRPLSRRGTGHPHPRPDVRIQPQRERGCFHVAGRSFLPTHVVARAQESGHAVGRDPRNAERRAPERQLGAPTGGRSGQCPSQPGCPHRERWPRFALAWCGHGQAWQSITSGRTCRAVVTVIRPWADRSKGLPSCGRLWAMRHLCGAVHRLDRRRP